MDWYKIAKKDISNEELNRRLKSIIRSNSFFQKLFHDLDVPIDRIDDKLTFTKKKLNGRYAQGNSEDIYINERLFDNGDFFENKIHFIVHEIVHWLTRQREKDFYFTDPEEIDAFVYGILYELLRGKREEEIRKVFYPIISKHFENKNNAQRAYRAMFEKALSKIDSYKQRR